MKHIFFALNTSPLFSGIKEADFETLLHCLGAVIRTYDKGEAVYWEGDPLSEIGLVVSGRLHLTKSDLWGIQSVITEVSVSEMFAEAAVCAGLERIPLNVSAKEASEVLFINYKKLVTPCQTTCEFHTKLIHNMIGILAGKNVMMLSKLEHLTKRTTKEKLLSYLSGIARQKSSNTFEIPYNRQELADYLAVERSALSAVMSKLKSDGIINYKKNHFELLQRNRL